MRNLLHHGYFQEWWLSVGNSKIALDQKPYLLTILSSFNTTSESRDALSFHPGATSYQGFYQRIVWYMQDTWVRRIMGYSFFMNFVQIAYY